MPLGRILLLDGSDAVREVVGERGLAETNDEPDLVFAPLRDAEPLLARHPDAAVVLVTAEPPGSPVVRRALRMGAFAVLHEPLRREDVRRVLDEADAEQ